MTEQLHFLFSPLCIGEGNGNPLQYSCLENPRDGGAWWAVLYGVAQSRTQLKRLSSSSSRPYCLGIFEGFSKNNVFWTICENYFSQLASLTSFWLFYWLACLLLCFFYTWKVIFVFLELLSGCEISQVVSSHRWGEYDLHWRQHWTDPVREESQFSSFFLSFFFF